MCCECGGGSDSASKDAACSLEETDALDSAGNSCKWYIRNKSSCGAFDNWNFKALYMCCACQPEKTEEVVEAAPEMSDEDVNSFLGAMVRFMVYSALLGILAVGCFCIFKVSFCPHYECCPNKSSKIRERTNQEMK